MTPENPIKGQIYQAANPKPERRPWPMNRIGSSVLNPPIPFPGTEAPPRERPRTGTGTEPPSPPTKRGLRGRTKAFLGGAAVVVGLTGAAGLYKTNSFVNEGVDSGLRRIGFDVGEIPVKPFDPNLKEQVVRGGPTGNARAATEKQILEFLQATPDPFEKPKVGEHSPSVKIIMGDIENLDIKIVKRTFDTKGGNLSSRDYYYVEMDDLYISGKGQFALDLVEGAEKVELKLAGNELRTSDIEATYTYSNGKKVRQNYAFWDSNYTPTDLFSNLPRYDPNKVTRLEDREKIHGQEFDLVQNPHLPLFTPKGTTRVTRSTATGTPGIDQIGLSRTLAEDNKQPLYSKSE